MYFSRLELASLPAAAPQLWRARGDAYALHHLVWELFSDGPERRRDFLYRHEEGVIYAVSQRPPRQDWAGAALAVKPYAPKLAAGQVLAFSLRANPIISRKDENRRQQRHDVVMEAKKDLERQGLAKDKWPPLSELTRQAGLAWLAARAEAHGFAFEPRAVMVEGYRQHQFDKRGGRGRVRLSTLDFSGRLQVADPARLVEVLYHGLGPAKGFGCGLMLVKGAG